MQNNFPAFAAGGPWFRESFEINTQSRSLSAVDCDSTTSPPETPETHEWVRSCMRVTMYQICKSCTWGSVRTKYTNTALQTEQITVSYPGGGNDTFTNYYYDGIRSSDTKDYGYSTVSLTIINYTPWIKQKIA